MADTTQTILEESGVRTTPKPGVSLYSWDPDLDCASTITRDVKDTGVKFCDAVALTGDALELLEFSSTRTGQSAKSVATLVGKFVETRALLAFANPAGSEWITGTRGLGSTGVSYCYVERSETRRPNDLIAILSPMLRRSLNRVLSADESRVRYCVVGHDTRSEQRPILVEVVSVSR